MNYALDFYCEQKQNKASILDFRPYIFLENEKTLKKVKERERERERRDSVGVSLCSWAKCGPIVLRRIKTPTMATEREGGTFYNSGHSRGNHNRFFKDESLSVRSMLDFRKKIVSSCYDTIITSK
jgi:hypothetical protein